MRAHQNCGKLIYETFVKDYVVFLHVVKDKLLFILQMPLKSKSLKKMSKKTYDPRLVWPYSLLLCGPTGCGKTTWIVELLTTHEEFKQRLRSKKQWLRDCDNARSAQRTTTIAVCKTAALTIKTASGVT